MNTKLGIQENLLTAIGYIIPIVALIAYFVETENSFVRFHSLQSIFFSLTVTAIFTILSILSCIIAYIPNIGSIIGCFFSLLLLLLSLPVIFIAIFLAIKAYNREHYKLPLIGEHVERIVYKY